MQVLLRERIEELGKVGDIVDVAAGYARNYLLRYGKAVAVTKSNIKAIEQEQEIRRAREEKLHMELNELKQQLDEVSITIQTQATEEGHLYGSVSARDIVEKLTEAGYTIEQEQLALDNHIKELGFYEIKVSLAEGIEALFTLWVVREEPQEPHDE